MLVKIYFDDGGMYVARKETLEDVFTYIQVIINDGHIIDTVVINM